MTHVVSTTAQSKTIMNNISRRVSKIIFNTWSNIIALPTYIKSVEINCKTDDNFIFRVTCNCEEVIIKKSNEIKKKDNLGQGVKKLELSSEYDVDSDFLVHSNLTHLELKTDTMITALPVTLETMIFNHYTYNISRNLLPYGLTKLVLPKNFNSTIKNIVPETVIDLEFGDDFNKELFDYENDLNDEGEVTSPTIYYPHFSPDIRRLKFGNKYNKELYSGCDNLEVLIFGNSYNKKIPELPKIVKLVAGDKFIDYDFNKYRNATSLKIGVSYNGSFDFSDSNLMELVIDCDLTHEIKIPATLLSLELAYAYNKRIDFSSSNLVKLKLGGEFNQNLDGCLPLTLKELELGFEFTHQLQPSLLNQLEGLTAHKSYEIDGDYNFELKSYL